MRILKNRLFIGCICIIVAFAIGFIAVPKVTDMLNDKINVVVLNTDVEKGDRITPDMLKLVQMSKGDVLYADNEFYNSIDVSNGKSVNNRLMFDPKDKVIYADIDMKMNDIVTDMKISETYPYKDEKLRALGDNEYAVAVSVTSLATSVSAKVMAGDIVTLLICKEDEEGAASVPSELMYVEVLNINNSDAIDINDTEAGTENGIPSVVTFKVNLYQAQLLAGFEQTSVIHLALVCRGDEEKAQELLNKQKQYFIDNDLLYTDAWFYNSESEVAAQ